MKIKSKELADEVYKSMQSFDTQHGFLKTELSSKEIDQIKKQLKQEEINVPDDSIQNIISSTLERDFLNDSAIDAKYPYFAPNKEQGWVRITRLPVSPLEDKSYALYPRWQNTIATLHTLNHQLCYVLLRENSVTKMYLGAIPTTRKGKGKDTQNQLMQAVKCQMPGIGLESIKGTELNALIPFNCCGAITGIPSVRKMNAYGEYQTMDQIVMGLSNHNGEQDFAVVILAMPVTDGQIVDSLRLLGNISSEVHALTQYSKTEGTNSGASMSLSYSDGVSYGANLSIGAGLGELIRADIGGNLSKYVSTSNVKGANIGRSDSISKTYINKSAMYCEEIIDKHIFRMKTGRNLGFWKTGIYVLADSESNVQTVMGMLRAVYSGDDSYIEPIRTKVLPSNSGADNLVRSMHIIPYANQPVSIALGRLFEDYATPITTEELSIATSLPRRDIPGLRVVRNASRFAANPPIVKERIDGGIPVNLGKMLDFGLPTSQIYNIDLNQLVRHTLVAGTNGSGKTNTCKTILQEIQKEGIPFLVIEPAKDEYLEWALEQNKCKKNNKILVYAPGAFSGDEIAALKLNPFQPAVAVGNTVNMLSHLDRFKSALLSSMPMYDVLPLIMEETIFMHVQNKMNVKGSSLIDSANPLDGPYLEDGRIIYPLVEEMVETAQYILEGRQYNKDVESNIKAAVTTRIHALLLGWKKSLFNVPRSTEFSNIFENHSVVINLSHLADDRDKAFVMSIILIALWEYRESKYRTDETYKEGADAGKLKHLTLIEEAHRLMPNYLDDVNGIQNAQANTSKMFSNMLSEIRAYGEGCIIVDQVPTRLIPDAVKNTNLKIIHRLTSSDDINAVSTSMMLRPDQEKVVGVLQPGEAIVCSDFDDSAAWVKIKKSKSVE